MIAIHDKVLHLKFWKWYWFAFRFRVEDRRPDLDDLQNKEEILKLTYKYKTSLYLTIFNKDIFHLIVRSINKPYIRYANQEM